MYKLKTLYNEIKLLSGNITPKSIKQLLSQYIAPIWDSVKHTQEGTMEYDWVNIIDKYGRHNFNYDEFDKWLDSLDNNKLKNLYIELSNLINKHNLK